MSKNLVLEELVRLGAARDAPLAIVVGDAPGHAVGLAAPAGAANIRLATPEAVAGLVATIDAELRPRWVMWSSDTARRVLAGGTRLATCWDIAAVHRLLFGGWQADPAVVWAELHELGAAAVPALAPADLFSSIETDGSDPEQPVQPDGHLRPAWASGGWADSPARLSTWAAIALRVMSLQQQRLAERPRATSTARSDSAAELLCVELEVDGLPMDRNEAERIVAWFVGPRPVSERDAEAQRGRRDADVLRFAPSGTSFDLRSPADVKSLLRRVGIEVPDTRAWRLEALRAAHPVVDALLTWRKAERVGTTFGYAWLDAHLGADGRLRGHWTGCDGAAGRMTASAGLHNMPTEMRRAVIAEPAHAFVRADLGQIEPRVLAAISDDGRLAAATSAADLYAAVAAQLGVARDVAKVAVLGAMYGQTTGRGAQALVQLEAAYPVAMEHLGTAALAAQRGIDLRTYGGRLVRMGSTADDADDADGAGESVARSRAAARGRYGRNAVVQGAAAELFKVWAVLVRARAARFGASIVLCLHDELLVHVPVEHAEAVAQLLDDCLQEAAHRWAPNSRASFVADISVLARWSDAKP